MVAGLWARGRLMPDEGTHASNGTDAQPDESDLLQRGAQVEALMQTGDEVRNGDVDHAGRDKAQQ